MPQTREAIDHAKAAGVPIIVAINKIDKPDANPERVKRELADLGLMPEEWGGQTVMVEVSAKKRQNLELLLEMILLVTDIGELKANPKRAAIGHRARSQARQGPRPGRDDPRPGRHAARRRHGHRRPDRRQGARADRRPRPAREGRPGRRRRSRCSASAALPQPGDSFQAIDDAAKARQIATVPAGAGEGEGARRQGRRASRSNRCRQQIAEGGVKELPIIIKADVQGSAEVLADTLTKLSDEKVKIRIIHSGVGAINESDVLLASASNAIIIGFNVRPDRNAADVAEREHVDIRLHSVIYNVIDEMKKAMAGLLEPTFKEVRLGAAEVREIFKVPKVGTIAGCMVTDGTHHAQRATRRRACCATTSSSTRARSARCAASRTTCREVKAGLRVRHRPRALQRHQGRRRHRGVRRRAGRAPATASSGRRRGAWSMVVALLSVELHLPGARSLKDKRMVLRRVKDRLAKFNVAVAEVEHHDLWQRAALGIVTISTTERARRAGAGRGGRRDRARGAGADHADRRRVPDASVERPMAQRLPARDRVADQIREEISRHARARGARSRASASSRSRACRSRPTCSWRASTTRRSATTPSAGRRRKALRPGRRRSCAARSASGCGCGACRCSSSSSTSRSSTRSASSSCCSEIHEADAERRRDQPNR